jgi:hypothetical protein
MTPNNGLQRTCGPSASLKRIDARVGFAVPGGRVRSRRGGGEEGQVYFLSTPIP